MDISTQRCIVAQNISNLLEWTKGSVRIKQLVYSDGKSHTELIFDLDSDMYDFFKDRVDVITS